MRSFFRWVLIVWVAGLSFGAFAELKVARVFSDNMVLQQGQKLAVWGWASPGEMVVIEFGDQKKETKAGSDGKWLVKLSSMKSSAEGRVLVVSGDGGRIEIKDVLVGEVWLCSGQSNMGMKVKDSDNFEQEQAAADFPLIRMFTVKRTASLEPEDDCEGSWEVCGSATVGDFSATAYFFGREIHKKLDVPVGLINSSWGGTIIEAWSPMKSLEKFPAVMAKKADIDARSAAYDEAAEKAKHEAALAKWKERLKQGEQLNQRNRPKLRGDPQLSQNYHASLYNAMICPVVPYGIKGAIWYQGEANARNVEEAVLYKDLLANLIKSWRRDWDDEFPFYFVQLPGFKAVQIDPVEDHAWAFIRESFLKVTRTVPETGMAIGIDVGMKDDIHPKNKQAIGYRLAQCAFGQAYKVKDVVACGPVYKSMKKDGNKIVVKFDYAGSGLVAKDGDLRRFAIAGEDRKFVNATAVIAGDAVEVSSPEVAKPVAVRYAWAQNPEGCNLYNSAGLPASPFRTDDWEPAGVDDGDKTEGVR